MILPLEGKLRGPREGTRPGTEVEQEGFRGRRDEILLSEEDEMKAYATVAVSVADLRRKPTDAPDTDGRDDGRLSQLLYNELLLVTDEQGDWLRVEAVEQRKYLGPVGWGGYPGWVRKKAVTVIEKPPGCDALIRSARAAVTDAPSPDGALLFYLSFGTRLSIAGETKGFLEIPLPHGKSGWVSKKDAALADSVGFFGQRVGQDLTRLARLFVGAPYLWGGRSMPLPTSATGTGVDCSGLVNLVFRAFGKDVPRDAVDQWRASRPIDARDLEPGDLIFLSPEEDPGSINHVMLSLGRERFIEAPHTGEVVRIRSFSDIPGCNPTTRGQNGFAMQSRKVRFGRIEG